MGKKAVVHIHHGVLLSRGTYTQWDYTQWNIKQNASESVLMRWMEQTEPILQSEVSQKQKHQYSILTHIYGT